MFLPVMYCPVPASWRCKVNRSSRPALSQAMPASRRAPMALEGSGCITSTVHASSTSASQSLPPFFPAPPSALRLRLPSPLVLFCLMNEGGNGYDALFVCCLCCFLWVVQEAMCWIEAMRDAVDAACVEAFRESGRANPTGVGRRSEASAESSAAAEEERKAAGREGSR